LDGLPVNADVVIAAMNGLARTLARLTTTRTYPPHCPAFIITVHLPH